MDKKGQAAMEFLMTYGWAILATVIVIGVLAYFGVFSPSKYVPTSCLVSAPFGCDKNQVAATGGVNTSTVTLVLRNGGGESLDVSSVAIAGCGTYSTAFPIADQGTKTVPVTCNQTLTVGSKFNGAVSVTYIVTDGTLPQIASGSVTVKVA